MSFIGSMLSGSNGAGFQAGGVNIDKGANIGQATQAYDQTQQGLQQQQAFLQALQGQNGIGNQQSVFNQLQGVANGTGPNPAQAQLANATGANTANQAALMASQRGTGANPGLIARQAAMQGAANQQNAVGQAASLQAQQSLGALNQLGGIAGQQVGQQAGALQGYNAAAQGQQQNLLNSINAQNNAVVGMQSNINNANAGIAQVNAKSQSDILGGLTGGVGSALIPKAYGGEIHKMASGGEVNGPSSFAGKFLKGSGINSGGISSGMAMPDSRSLLTRGSNSLGSAIGSGIKSLFSSSTPDSGDVGAGREVAGGTMTMAKGGKVDAILSPGEKYLPPSEAKKVAEGKESVKKVGKTVPGKPDGKKDSLKNDTVPAKLDEGGFVIPNSIMQSKDPEKGAAAFVRAHMSRQSKVSKK